MYDVIVIGGGPAGLSAALVLGRCNRRVLVIDSEEYRNRDARAMHGFLSRDGTPPDELLRIAREQLAPYPVERITGRVIRAERGERGFTLRLADERTAEARKLLLATGVVDRLPDIPGLRPLYGKSVHVCPYCDAWELRGQPLAVHGDGGAQLALSLRTWTDDVVLLTDGTGAPDGEQAELLAAMQVRVIDTPVRRLVGDGGELETIEFADGSELRRRALFLKLGKQRQRCDLPHQLGVRVGEDDDGAEVDVRARTCVPGVYVAGDASVDVMFAVVAAAEGATAAFALNRELQEEEQARALQQLRARGR
jgi:thioredoxin reductase